MLVCCMTKRQSVAERNRERARKELELNDYASSAEELDARADERAKEAPKELYCLVYYYHIARYLVAIYQSRYKKVPVQVWNEYRSALDHMMRYYGNSDCHLTIIIENGNEECKNQILAAERHMLRAALDACKYLCIDSDDLTKDLIKIFRRNMFQCKLLNIDFSSLAKRREEARVKNLRASTMDFGLGNSISSDKDVLNLYLIAFFDYNDLVKEMRKLQIDVSSSRAIIAGFRRQVAVRERIEFFVFGVVSSLLGTVLYMRLWP